MKTLLNIVHVILLQEMLLCNQTTLIGKLGKEYVIPCAQRNMNSVEKIQIHNLQEHQVNLLSNYNILLYKYLSY